MIITFFYVQDIIKEKLELTKQIYNAHSNEICLCIELERKNKEIIIASMEYNKNFIKLWNI